MLSSDAPFTIGRPKPLFRTAVTDMFEGRNRFVSTPDGQKFVVEAADSGEQPRIGMLVNWSPRR